MWKIVIYVVGSRRFGSDPLDLGTDIRPYSLPTPLGVHQELSGYARAASWGPPSTTMPFATLSTFLPPADDTSASTEVSRRPSLSSSLIRPADTSTLGSTLAVQDFLRQQQNATCQPSEPRTVSFPVQKPPSASSSDPNIDEIRQSLLCLTSLNSFFETNSNSPFSQTTLFDQSVPALSDSSHKQQSFPSAPTSFLQPGTFSTVSPPTFDPNFNAITTAPLGQLALATTCSENFWQTSCLPFGDTNIHMYPGNRMATHTSQAAAAANNNGNIDDTRQDSSLWRPY